MRVHINLPEEMVEELTEAAKGLGVSRNAVCVLLLRRGLKRLENESSKPIQYTIDEKYMK